MTDDIKALIEDLRSWADACGARPGDGAFAIGAHDGKLSFVEKTRPSSGDLQRLLTATLREAATALERLSGQGKMLQWESAPGHRWLALGGMYEIVRTGDASTLFICGKEKNFISQDRASTGAMRFAQEHYEREVPPALDRAGAPEHLSGRVRVKPLHLSALVRDAFLAGRGLRQYGKCSEADLAAWTDYEPPSELYERILAALDPATARDDALEEAAVEIDCGCDGECLAPHNCPREYARTIRALKGKPS